MDQVRDALLEMFTSEAAPLAKRNAALDRIIRAVEGSGRVLVEEIGREREPWAANES